MFWAAAAPRWATAKPATPSRAWSSVTSRLRIFAGCSKQADPSAEADPSDNVTTDTENTQATEETTSGDEELEPVTLKWYYVDDGMEGSADVIKAFNKKIVYVGTTDHYFEQWPLLLAGGEEMDIAYERTAGYFPV